jgi:hypothetical protein
VHFYDETTAENVGTTIPLMELNFLEKNNSDHEKNSGATKWSPFENEKQLFGL